MRAYAVATGAIIGSLIAASANGQALQGPLSNVGASNFARDRNVSVRQRPHPEYAPPAHRAGAFQVRPSVTASGEYNDNVLAATAAKQHDFILTLRPRLDVESTWSRHSLAAFAEVTSDQYADVKSQNTTNWIAGATGRLDIVRKASLSFGADAGKFAEPRTAVSTQFLSVKPIRYQSANMYVSGVREFNRLRLSTRFDYHTFDYHDGVTATGSGLEQDDRDYNAKSLIGRVDYAVSPASALFVQLTGNWRDYRLKAPLVAYVRDSAGYEALAGANLEVSNGVRGEIGVGYISQSFRDPAFKDIGGLGARGQVQWFPTQLTTVTATMDRSVRESGLVTSPGFLSTNFNLQVDHELLRNLILTAQGGYGRDVYRELRRDDRRLSFGASATYLLNRRVSVVAQFDRFDLKSSGLGHGLDFRVNRASVALKGVL